MLERVLTEVDVRALYLLLRELMETRHHVVYQDLITPSAVRLSRPDLP